MDGEVLAGAEFNRFRRVETAVAFIVSLGSRHIASSFLFHFRRQAASKISSRQASISIIVNKTTHPIL
jgi:hypothetical protein